ncbi:MAG TPA: serine protease, partial [Candidatus Limnocylindrales bacterium]|nr:serine protease [Candidatus Limnocylindrales bacterium]
MKKKTVCFRVVSLVILLAIMLALSASVSAQTSIEDARKSVVRIVALETGWENMRFPAFSVASGFIVGEQAPFEYVATAWHVVDPARIGAESVDIFIYRSRDDLVPARVHVALEVVDIVLLRLDPAHLLHGYEPLYIGRREMASVGDEVFAIGFPAAADVALTDIPAAFYTNATVTRGIISRLTTVAGVAYYQMDASVSPGNSGGP